MGQAEKEGLRVGREGQVEEIGEAEEEGTCTGSGSKGLFRFTLDERAECAVSASKDACHCRLRRTSSW